MSMKKNRNECILPNVPLKEPILNPTKEQQNFYSNKISKNTKEIFFKLVNDEVHSKYESIHDIDIGDEFINSHTPKGVKFKAVSKAYINIHGIAEISIEKLQRRDRHDDGGVQQGI